MYILIGKDRLKKVEGDFPVSHLDVDRLLANWRWLCPAKMHLLARNAFGDLFLGDEGGRVHWLDVGARETRKAYRFRKAIPRLPAGGGIAGAMVGRGCRARSGAPR